MATPYGGCHFRGKTELGIRRRIEFLHDDSEAIPWTQPCLLNSYASRLERYTMSRDWSIMSANTKLFTSIQVQYFSWGWCNSFVCLLLLYAVISWWWYDVWDENPEPTLLLTQGIFNLPHHIGIVWEELAFDNASRCKLYTAGKCVAAQLNAMAVTGFEPLSPTPSFNQLSYLIHPPNVIAVNKQK